MTDTLSKSLPSTPYTQGQATLGRTVTLKGDLSGNEDLAVEGQFEGSIDLQERTLTVGPSAQVKAEIHAARVIIHGSVSGNITARDKVEIRKTGRVVGDLISPGIGIEEGAYFKGSIEILREDVASSARASIESASEATV